jgi:hypothetical protein
MPWLPVKHSFFYIYGSIGAACDVEHGQNVKRKERTEKKKNRTSKERNSNESVILSTLVGNTQLLNRIIISITVANRT